MSKAAVNCRNCRALTLIPCRLEGIGDFPPATNIPWQKQELGQMFGSSLLKNCQWIVLSMEGREPLIVS